MKEHKDIKIKSYLWIYWTLWVVITSVTIYLKCNYFVASQKSFNLMVTYALGLWIPLMGLSSFEFYRLRKYIKEVYPDEYEKMTENFAGLGISQNKLKFFLEDYSEDDEMLSQLGNNLRKFDMFMKVVFFFLFIMGMFVLQW